MDMLWLMWTVFASLPMPAQAQPLVQTVRFDGNRKVATATLRAVAAKLGATIAGDDGPERLSVAVLTAYFDAGYVTARVDEPRLARDGTLVVHVSEGPRFFVRAISFSGAWPRATAELRAELGTHSGDAFNRARIAADVARLSSLVDGAAVAPITRLDVEHHTVDLELALLP
jgi:outer membrane protein assembly factor BamA